MKDFANWHILKKALNSKNDLPFFKEREIWWCSIGVNVGHEQDGKSEAYSRPVLVIRKFNKRIFWGVPLTTQIKDKSYYHKFTFKGRLQGALLTQLRLLDANRLTRRMGRLGMQEFEVMKKDLSAYLK